MARNVDTSPGANAAVAPSAGNKVSYSTSDHLVDRHPFRPAASFETQRQRDAGRVLHGIAPETYDALIHALTDVSLDPRQRAVALKHLLGYTASAEKKVLFLRKDLVPILASVLQAPSSKTTPAVEELAARLLRSLAIIPQGAHCTVVEGGLEGLVTSIRNTKDADQRLAARSAAVAAVVQIASCWDGREWLLGLDGASGMQFPDRAAPSSTEAQRDALARETCDTLSHVLDNETDVQLVTLALQAVSLITMEPKGLQLCLIAGALRSTSKIFQRRIDAGLELRDGDDPATAMLLHAVSVVGHIAMDAVGKREATELPLFRQLTHIGLAAIASAPDSLFQLKSALMACGCALALHVELKSTAIVKHETTAGPCSFLEAAVKLLRHANRLHDPMASAKKRNEPNPFEHIRLLDVQSVVKSCVQVVRLLCELPAARAAVHKLLPVQEEYDLRRQLFYATDFQEEFSVRPV